MWKARMRNMVSLLLVSGSVLISLELHAQPPKQAMGDPSDIAEELAVELGLDEGQTAQATTALGTFARSLEAAQAQQEGAEEPDGQAMMSAINAARSQLFTDMRAFMTPDQYSGFEALVDEVMNEIFTTVAEIRLIDMQAPLSLTDAQLEQLAPVLGGSIRSVINLVMENSDKRMGIRQKLQMARSMKKIKADADAQMSSILSPAQMQQLKDYQEQRRG